MQLTEHQANLIFTTYRVKHYNGGLTQEDILFVRQVMTAFKIAACFHGWLSSAGLTFITEEADVESPGFAHGGD